MPRENSIKESYWTLTLRLKIQFILDSHTFPSTTHIGFPVSRTYTMRSLLCLFAIVTLAASTAIRVEPQQPPVQVINVIVNILVLFITMISCIENIELNIDCSPSCKPVRPASRTDFSVMRARTLLMCGLFTFFHIF